MKQTLMRHRAPLLLCFLMLVGTAVAQSSIAATGCMSAAANGTGDHCGGTLEPHSWTVQQTFTVQHPFVMFHQRKAGGSSWRSVIMRGVVAQTKNNNGTFIPRAGRGRRQSPLVPSEALIPCHTHSCEIFEVPSPPRRPAYSAIAGHISWGGIHMFLPPGIQGQLQGLRGLTNFRDPVTRVVSCLRFRFPRDGFQSADSFARLSVDQLRQFLLHRRDSYGNGCNNEPIRMLSGYSDEPDINELGLSQNRHLAEALVEQSKRHILASVVCAVLEKPLETLAVVSHYFPWMQLPKKLPHDNANRAPEGSKTGGDMLMSEEQRQMVLELNWPEVEIYDFANRILSREYNSLLTGNNTVDLSNNIIERGY